MLLYFAAVFSPYLLTHAELLADCNYHRLQVLIDLGANENFMNWNLVLELGFQIVPLPMPQEANTSFIMLPTEPPPLPSEWPTTKESHFPSSGKSCCFGIAMVDHP